MPGETGDRSDQLPAPEGPEGALPPAAGRPAVPPPGAAEPEPHHLLPAGAHPTAGDRFFEAGLDRLAGTMERTGRRVAMRGELWDREGGPRSALAGAAQRAGDALTVGADYIRDQDPAAVRAGLEARVRRRPLAALAGAVAAGFVLGRVLRS